MDPFPPMDEESASSLFATIINFLIAYGSGLAGVYFLIVVLGALQDLSGTYKQQKEVQEDTAKEEIPKWLESLQGKSPLLSRSECEFLADIRSRMKNKPQGKVEACEAQILQIKENTGIITAYFEIIVEKLRTNSSSRKHYKGNYPLWRKVRDRNVKHLRIIANSIDDDKQNCQTSKVIGSSVSFIGGILCLAAGGIISLVGSAMMGIGSLTSAGTSVAEKKLLQKNVDEAKKIMQRDEKYLMRLVKCLDDASCLQKTLDSIKSISYNEDILTAAEKFRNISKSNLKKKKEVDEEIEMAIKSFNFPPEVKEEVSNTVGILVSLSMLFVRFLPVFKLALKSHNTLENLRLAADILRASYVCMNAVENINNGGELTKGKKYQVAAGMILDAVNILLVLMEDSKSVEGQNIRQAASELEKEANQFGSLYEAMKCFED